MCAVFPDRSKNAQNFLEALMSPRVSEGIGCDLYLVFGEAPVLSAGLPSRVSNEKALERTGNTVLRRSEMLARVVASELLKSAKARLCPAA